MTAGERQPVLLDVADGIATISLNRPDFRNAVTPAMTDMLVAITEQVERDDAIRCVVLRGTGSCFSAGGDVSNFRKQLTENREHYVANLERRLNQSNLMIGRFRRMPKPVLASVHVAVSGIGLSLSLAADFVIAAEGTTFVLVHRHIGLAPDGGASYFLPRIIGERRALELALLGERFDAARALELGIVNWVSPADELEQRTAALALKLAGGPTAAMASAKALIRSSLDHDWGHMAAEEARIAGRLVATSDHLEGVIAFLEKRPPNFTGT
jgi:2-(1,2-epoxy-1,2-dihydrophenyl)acetyl-CoA isomerase